MDWRCKAAALNALAELSIKCRGPDDWYIEQNVHVRGDCVLIGAFGNGKTPEAAIEDHWRQLVTEIGATYLVARDGRDTRRAIRWNGFMWDDVPEPKKAAA